LIALSPYKIFAYSGRISNVTVIDAATNQVVETIKLDGKPESSTSDGKRKDSFHFNTYLDGISRKCFLYNVG
jgi:YVTN family beta-propeller protein